jgi:hypothetical protein
MPTVSSFEQFVTAMRNAVDGDIITLANDLDFNGWIPPDGTTYPIHCPGTQDQLSNVTINGNGHAIYNISNGFQGSNKGLFYLHTLTNQNNCWVFKNIQFLNINQMNENDANFIRSNLNLAVNWTNQPIVFEDCVFQGVINSPFTYQAGYKRCMFTINSLNGKINSIVSNNVNFYDMCWFWLKNIMRMSNDPFIYHMRSCYVKGNHGAMASNTNNLFFRDCEDCCINFEADLTSSTQNKVLSNIVQPSSNTAPKTVVNTDKLKGTADSTSAAIIGVNDETMHDANALFELGFKILPT